MVHLCFIELVWQDLNSSQNHRADSMFHYGALLPIIAIAGEL